jgi:phage shock protein A
MGIMTRFTRIFKADIHGVMDQIENKELILKQCLREMEASLSKKQASLVQLRSALEQVRDETRKMKREKEKTEQDLRIAIIKEKDDIARLLIRKRMKADHHIEIAFTRTESFEKQIALLTENIDAQKHQYAEMQLRAESWIQRAEHKQWEESAPAFTRESFLHAISDEEIELELIKQKDAVKGGV